MFNVDGEKAGETEEEREQRKARRLSLIEKSVFVHGTSVRAALIGLASACTNPPMGLVWGPRFDSGCATHLCVTGLC